MMFQGKQGRLVGLSVAAVCCISGALAGCGAVSSGSSKSDSGSCDPKDVTLVQSGRGLDNEYYVAVDKGAKAFAKSKGLESKYQWIASDGDSSKQLSQIKSILAKGGKCVVLNVDANESSIVPAIVKAVDKAGAWLVTQWNRPTGFTPKSYGSPHWVAHMSVDGVPQGYDTAKALFESMGGKGSIVALQGILDNPPQKERQKGLEKALAEYPGIKVLGQQTAGWDRTKGQNITQTYLTKYKGQIGGVWAANDSMALGALEAVKNDDLTGKVKVSGVDGLAEAIADIKKPGSGYVATTQSTAVEQGAYGLALGFAAATGDIKPGEEPDGRRSFYLKPLEAINSKNAGSVPDPTDTSALTFDDPFVQAGDPIK